jgi:uncharacterized protein YfaS (alpha-2-macroglobulin family)
VTPATVAEVTTLHTGIEQLLLDQTNAVVIGRTASGDQTGKGQLYYTTHLKTYQPVEDVKPLSRGVTINREYRLADCGLTDSFDGLRTAPKKTCPAVTQAKVGDVLDVKLTVVVPNSLYYVVVEDPLPAGTEALDTSLKTTSKTTEGPQVDVKSGDAAPGVDRGWQPTHVELRDEKAVLFETALDPGTYEFSYQIRASLPGEYLTLPPTASQMYFPEVWGRGAGSTFTVTE